MYRLYTFFDIDHIDSSTLSKWMRYLPEERRTRALRYRREIDVKLSVISYLLLLYALFKEYGLSSPAIAYTDCGKPYLRDHQDIYFNISHCPAGCVCAVSDAPIGVDIQDTRPFSMDIAKYCCSQDELDFLQKSKNPALDFARIWAMKESYLKMTGEGISRHLPSVDTNKLSQIIKTFVYNGCCIAVALQNLREGSE